MADAGASARAAARSVVDSFRVLSLEQKVAAVASLLLIASTFGPFSFIEAAELATALGVLVLLHFRAQGRRFHLPFGDGTVIAAAGVWVGLLIVVRLFDRPLGQNLLALACAAILAIAGASERAKRPPDDLPDEPRRPRRSRHPDGRPAAAPPADDAIEQRRAASRRRRRAQADAVDEPLAPPEFELPAKASARPDAPPPDAPPSSESAETVQQLSLEDVLADENPAGEQATELADDPGSEPTRRLPRDQD